MIMRIIIVFLILFITYISREELPFCWFIFIFIKSDKQNRLYKKILYNCAGRCTLGRLFGIRVAARPCAWRYAIAHCMTDKFHVTNCWQSSHMTRRTAEGQNMELTSHLFEEWTRLLMNPRFNMSRSKGWDPLGFDSK